jgi:hypothetical protein
MHPGSKEEEGFLQSLNVEQQAPTQALWVLTSRSAKSFGVGGSEEEFLSKGA